MRCVLDASITLTWLLKDAGEQSGAYAFDVLKQIRSAGTEIYVPATWGLEIANGIARSEAKGTVTEAQSGGFLAMLSELPITVDGSTAAHA